MPLLGERTCMPVGWLGCPEGFEAVPFGCAAVLPAEPCTGARRADLGSRACVPIGDCDAPFPPTDATVFVDPSFPDSRVDAAHHRTIGTALSAAAAGATVAVAPGLYREALRIQRPVRLVGRCAAEVVVSGTGLGKPGLLVTRGAEATVEGMSFREHQVGVTVDADSGVTIRDSLIEANADLGVLAKGLVALDRCVIRDTRESASGHFGYGLSTQGGSAALVNSEVSGSVRLGVLCDRGATLSMRGTVVTRTRPPRSGTREARGVVAQGCASASIEDSALVANEELGLLAALPGTSVSMARSSIEGTGPESPTANGAIAQTEASLRLSEVTIRWPAGLGLGVLDDASAEVERSSILGNRQPSTLDLPAGLNVRRGAKAALRAVAFDGLAGAGLIAGAGATLRGEALLVAGMQASSGGQTSGQSYGWGLLAYEGAQVEFSKAAILDCAQVGAMVADSGTRFDLRRSLVGGTRSDPASPGGIGLVVSLDAIGRLEGSALVGNAVAGLLATHATAYLLDSAVSSASAGPEPGETTFGVVGMDGASLLASSSTIASSDVGLAFEASQGALTGCSVVANDIGIHVQGGSRLALAPAPASQVIPLEVTIAPDTVFLENQQKVGTGLLSLPDLGAITY